VEVTFLYPWALVFKALREAKLGLFVFAEVLLFLLILTVGYIYCWRKGDLDWVKTVSSKAFPAHRLPASGREAEARESVTEKITGKNTERITGKVPGEPALHA